MIPTPNFPSYISGHSTMSAAASVIMGELFPTESNFFKLQAHEAANSRLWAGIHYPQDNQNGLILGVLIGEKALSDMKKPFHALLVDDISSPEDGAIRCKSERSVEFKFSCNDSRQRINPAGIARQRLGMKSAPTTMPRLGTSFYNNVCPPKYGWRI